MPTTGLLVTVECNSSVSSVVPAVTKCSRKTNGGQYKYNTFLSDVEEEQMKVPNEVSEPQSFA